MIELIWVHRFNANELGLGNRGAFCLVPVDARAIFPELSERNNYSSTVHLSFMENFDANETYKKPPSKSEYRLSLSGLGDYIGTENSQKPIKPGVIACFYKKGNNVHFEITDENSVYSRLLTELASHSRPNNIVATMVGNNTVVYDFSNKDKLALPKPFILLAGISGTGKTRFVREQALATDESKENYCLVSVRPDWHEPSDLLGYITRFSGKPEYVSTKVLEFIISAWSIAAPDANADGSGELDLNAIPYWLCLDEMNLAPVEQYFADYLSVLETRNFKTDGYFCEPLVDKVLLQDLDIKAEDLQGDLGLTGRDDLWQYFLNHGISLPPNLIVAGTVNMDETTHGFSRKVIDRAFTFDFGEFFPNNYDSFFEPETKPKVFTYPLITQVEQNNLLDTIDTDGTKSIAFLDSVNSVLKQTPFELAYRALNELLLQVACFKPETEAQLQAIWDDFLMSKLLPRIDGDEDKLRVTQDDEITNLLDVLTEILKEQLNEIWDGTRLDYYREMQDGAIIEDITCRTKTKLLWMKNRLEVNTFTSFWP